MLAQLDLFAQTAGGEAPFRIGSAGAMLPPAIGPEADPYITLDLYLERPDRFLPHRDPSRPRVSFRVDTGWKIEPGTDRTWYEQVAAYFATHDLDPRRPKTLQPLIVKRPDDQFGYGGALGYAWDHVKRFKECQRFHQGLMQRRAA